MISGISSWAVKHKLHISCYYKCLAQCLANIVCKHFSSVPVYYFQTWYTSGSGDEWPTVVTIHIKLHPSQPLVKCFILLVPLIALLILLPVDYWLYWIIHLHAWLKDGIQFECRRPCIHTAARCLELLEVCSPKGQAELLQLLFVCF